MNSPIYGSSQFLQIHPKAHPQWDSTKGIPSPHIQHPPKRNHGCFGLGISRFFLAPCILDHFGVLEKFRVMGKNWCHATFRFHLRFPPPAPHGRRGWPGARWCWCSTSGHASRIRSAAAWHLGGPGGSSDPAACWCDGTTQLVGDEHGLTMFTLWWTNIAMERSTMLLMGKSTISMAIFHSFLYVHQRVAVFFLMVSNLFFFELSISYIWDVIRNHGRTHIFQRGGSTTNHVVM